MRKSIVSLVLMLLFVATLMSNLVYAYVLIPESGTYVSLPGSPSESIVTEISGVKFYDSNANGKRDEGEAGIEGWKILLYKIVDGNWMLLFSTTTDIEGRYTFEAEGGIYRVVEVAPSEAWIQTAPLGGYYEINATLGGTYPGNDFGNVYLMPGYGGKTIGFWGSKNGQALINFSDVTELNGLNLYTPNGWNYPLFNTTDLAKAKTQIENYLRNATAVNTSWMLSAQLIATKLNVLHGFLSNETRVYIESSGTFITIGKIMENAYEALQGADRDAQEYWKNLLDWVNNNWLPLVSPRPPVG
jgi:hypothetical protein